MTDYNKLKVTELKDLLKDRGIPSTGLSRKNQIVEALEAHDATNNAGGEVNGDGAEKDVVAEEDTAQEEPESVGEELATTAQESLPETAPVDEDISTQDHEPAKYAQPAPEAVATELEKNEPLSKEPSAINTPQQASPAAESTSSDTRKRKRRSPTPPLSAESVNKKLKAAEEETVILPEDEVVADAPAPVTDTLEPPAVELEPKAVFPSSVSDDVMDVTNIVPSEVDIARDGSPMDTTAPTERLDIATEEVSGPPSTHPSTRALYIRDLVRPLQPQQLQDHLIDIASSPSSDSVIKTFHLNTLRTHAFVVFDTLQAASTARAALHGQVWPVEPSRKELWVDFVPESKVQDWIDDELASGGRRDAKKWEVIYETDEEGRVTAVHQEVTSLPPAPGVPRQSSFSNAPQAQGPGQGMPNAPSGPRADRPSDPSHRPPPPDRTASSPKATRAPSNATFDVLDQNFNHTSNKPKLYWLPVDKELAERRMEEITGQTSRSWEGGRAMRDATAIESQLRRYTFEDGDRIVDNGADIPSFRSEGGRPPGSGRGGRGGGGFRGRR